MIRASGARGSGFDPRSGPARFFVLFAFPSLLLYSMIRNKILNFLSLLLKHGFNHRIKVPKFSNYLRYDPY